MILVRPVLVVVCTVFAILMNSCYGFYDECANREAYCNDSTVANFKLSTNAKNWWINDSIKSGNVVFNNADGATIELYKAFSSNKIKYLQFDQYVMNLNDDCKEELNCPIQIKYTGYQMNYYNSEFNFKITIDLNREIPFNTANLDSTNWSENIAFLNKNNTLKLIPGINDGRFNKSELIPTISLNNKTFSNVYHVYDSSLLNKSSIEIMGYYFNAKQGIVRYYLNNNDVWTLQ